MSKANLGPSKRVHIFPVSAKTDASGDDRRRAEQMISCSKCDKTQAVPTSSLRGLPHDMVTKKFRELGWQIGSNRNHDLCPECSTPRRKPRIVKLDELADALSTREIEPREFATEVVELTPAETLAEVEAALSVKEAPAPEAAPFEATPEPAVTNVMPLAAPAPAPRADAPREPTREDRRRVMSALEDVYAMDRKCYVRGHNDKSVAKILGMPWAWVAKLRDEFFGPEGSEDTYRLLEEMESVKAEHARVMDALNKALLSGQETLNKLHRQTAAVEAQIKGLLEQSNRDGEALTTRLHRLQKNLDAALNRL